jgi:hypothetical protein
MKLIKQVYNPPRKSVGFSLEKYYEVPYLLKYSLARYALVDGLKRLGLKKGAKVLIPSFICRDVLAPFNMLNLEIKFYDVDQRLNPVGNYDELEQVDAILMVHFFGLKANINFFKNYCKKWNAFLIEDNAHGLFGKTENGEFLGQIGDIGIISVRKSLPIENGALLFLREHKLDQNKILACEKLSARIKIKNMLRPLVAFVGITPLKWVVNLKRAIRKKVLGTSIPESLPHEETIIDYTENVFNFETYVETVDVISEINRRIELFKFLANELQGLPIVAIREELTFGEVPYVYPFICSDVNLPMVKMKIDRLGLEIVKWPSLPNIVMLKKHPPFYNQVYLVKFLW